MSSYEARRRASNLRLSMAASVVAFVVGLATATVQSFAASEPSVAAAASLRDALDEIAALFEKEEGQKVKLTYGATGNLVAPDRGGRAVRAVPRRR